MAHACSQLTEPRLIIRTCKHILDRGRFCRAPAMNQRDYCQAHLRLRRCLWRMARAGRRLARVKLPPLVDAQSVQAAKVRVRVALAGGRVDRVDAECARVMSWALQMIATNFRAMERRPTLGTRGLTIPRDRATPGYHWPQKGSWGG